ncbi:MAG TPA: response regulator [Polyangiaceae bacterium]|nr:response regulator [Polyangiaceae bacterium]
MSARGRKTTQSPAPDLGEQGPRAQLIVIGGEEAGLVYPLAGDAFTLGRGTNVTLKVPDQNVSRLHARLTLGRDGWWIEDLGSRNGTFVNDAKVTSGAVQLGDRIRLGNFAELLLTEDDGIRDELLQRQRFEAVGRLSLGIAHDFNNMLAAISASIDYLSRTPLVELDARDYEACLQDMNLAVDRASLLAGRLLRSGRCTTGRPERVDLSKVMTEVVQLARRSFPRRVIIHSRVPRGVAVLGDAVAIHQIVMNLMVNARDAMPRGGDLTITLARRDGKAVVEVRDTGIGMDEETRARIFEPFFTTKHDARGFGLGLATVRALVERLGGRIEVESAPGLGTCFRITLREVTRVAQGRMRTSSHLALSVTPELNVLLADDEAVLRRALRRVLTSAGNEVVEAVDGIEAIERVTSEPIDLVILDVDMPRLEGSEACRMIHKLRPDLPIIILTGHDEAELRARLRDVGAAAVLSKPISADDLMAAVQAAWQLTKEHGRGRPGHTTVA